MPTATIKGGTASINIEVIRIEGFEIIPEKSVLNIGEEMDILATLVYSDDS